ncbi:twin-arginine translocase subunit TatC [Pseudodesulfovibrio sp. zrk46]|uniref:twin-arginine translocase subunit TatC n=1 Tax=Pseudodesulfovibrio sp. zrk46 TaxID=2725288 RepID=UPI001449FBCC|nr:twin-arginine translocase subunit TatC [Pseudodesulfovibrio sp. zrk46]QJB57300.1 twin-arginine translocase subunit TatC [Pseudodesulfovibrio sp. zrk46]
MSSEKDEKKEITSEEPVVNSPDETPDDDPSLEDAGMPVASEEEIAEAEQNLAVADGDASDNGTDSAEDTPEESDGEEFEEDEEGHMSLLDHLGELRLRLTRSFIAIAVGMLACYSFADKMFDILMEPMIKVFQKQAANNPILSGEFYDQFRNLLTGLMGERGLPTDQVDLFVDALQKSLMQVAQEGHFQYTYPAEAFFSHIKISIVAGLFLVSPYVFAQIWGFIAPGLYAHERKWMIPMALISAIFFTAGAGFGYFVVFPFGFEFFASFSTEGIQFTPKLNEYLSFCLKLLFAFGFVFELPLFIFFLARMGMVSSKGLREKRKYAILIGFVLAAILTPPDPFTQCLMAGPLIILYELGIWVAFFFGKNEKRHQQKREAEEAAKQAELDAAAAEAKAKEDEPEEQADKA